MNITSLSVVVALVALLPFQNPQPVARASPQTAQATLNCPCPQPTYQRISSSATLAQPSEVLPTHYVELDTDAGAFTLTLPPTPTPLTKLEVWLGSQPGGTATINSNGEAVTFTPGLSDMALDVANEGRVLLYVKPTPDGGGYWRVSEL